MNKFKECTTCHHVWENRDSFLSDPTLVLLGYQVNFLHLEAGLFLFSHETADCGTSLAIEAGEFADLYNGPIFETPHASIKKCPHYCLEETSLVPCPEKCECAYVREVLQIVKNWPKRKAPRKDAQPR